MIIETIHTARPSKHEQYQFWEGNITLRYVVVLIVAAHYCITIANVSQFNYNATWRDVSDSTIEGTNVSISKRIQMQSRVSYISLYS